MPNKQEIRKSKEKVKWENGINPQALRMGLGALQKDTD
jgi:hypothetical protein